MNNKSALELVNELLEGHKRDDLKSVIGNILDEMRNHHIAPLKKAISDVQEELRKVDPTTKLPGTLLDKQMGDMQSNLNPGAGADASTGMVKADPASAAPMLGSEKKHDWKSFMAKALTCSEKLTKPYVSDAQRGKFHAMEERGEISPKVVHEFDQASKGKSLPEHVKKAMPALGGTGTGAPSTPTARPDKGFGAVVVKAAAPAMPAQPPPLKMPKPPAMAKPAPMMKDDKPHPPGSPEERSHAVAEGMASLPKAAAQMNAKGHEATQRFFNHLRSLKDPRKQRSAANNLTPMGKAEEKPENQKDMSASAKTAIMEPSDKPMKVQPNRPGQANKPVKC